MRRLVGVFGVLALTAAACAGDTAATTTSAPSTTTITAQPAPTTTTPPATTTTTVATQAPADIVFTNGVVVTQDPDLGTVEAIAVTGDTITAVGRNADIDPYIGTDTRLVDLAGRTVIPGFVDPHTHILTDTGSVEAGQPMALEAGITTVGEAFINPERLETLVASSDSGELRLRTNLYLIRTDNCGGDQGTWYEAYPPGEMLSERVRVAGVKVFADGGTCGPLAVSEPFLEGVAVGTPFANQEVMDGYIRDANDAGYQLLVHAIGDLAIGQVMDAYENVLGPGGASTLRHRIDHNSFGTPDLIGRYDQLGLTASLFGWLRTCNLGPGWTEFWYDHGDELAPFLAANPNTTFAWHGDDPWIGPVSPLWEMFSMVTRAEPRDGEICQPPPRVAEDAITHQQAFDMMTTGSAYALNLDHVVGSLTPGKYADLVILTDNPLTVVSEQLLDIGVLMTMIGGRVEHCVEAVCDSLTGSTARAPTGSGECVAAPEGIISWWTGDTDATDLVGGNHGKLLDRSTIAPGAVGGAFKLKASAVSLGGQPDLTGGFTIEVWVNLDDPMAPFETVFNNNQVFLRKNPVEEGGGFAVFVKLEDGSVEGRAQSPNPVQAEAWTHLAATWDGSTLILFIDGVAVGFSERAGSLTPTTVEARIGSGEQEVVDGNQATGFIDELTIYERPLDVEDIGAIHAAGSDGKCRP